MSKFVLSALAVAFVSALPSCTLKHQEMLRDRDAEIRGLRGEVAKLRSRNSELERSDRSSQDTIRGLNAQLANASATKGGPSGLDALRKELTGANVRVENGRLKIGIDNTVTFDSGSSNVKNTANSLLSKVARHLKENFGGRWIYVEGHTDTDPIRVTKDKYRNNRHLSLERADAVAGYLINKLGLPASRVAVVGFGQYKPVTKGSGDSSKARNRRVEIVVGEPQ